MTKYDLLWQNMIKHIKTPKYVQIKFNRIQFDKHYQICKIKKNTTKYDKINQNNQTQPNKNPIRTQKEPN